jgi:hypothetical protein
MNLDESRNSLTANLSPEDLSFSLAALWWDAKGDWAKAHESTQLRMTREFVGARLASSERGCLVKTLGTGTGWLERFKPACQLDREWAEIVNWLLNKNQREG